MLGQVYQTLRTVLFWIAVGSLSEQARKEVEQALGRSFPSLEKPVSGHLRQNSELLVATSFHAGK